MAKKNLKYYKHWYKVHKEMHTHYEELYSVAFSELKFSRLQTKHFENMLDEVQYLIEKGVDNNLIEKVIDSGKTRSVLDQSIHYNLIGK